MSTTNNILDSNDLEEEELKNRIGVTLVWACFGVLTLFNSVERLYSYSEGGFFFDVIPIYFIYESIVIGLFSIAISLFVFAKNPSTTQYIMIFFGALFFYILTEKIMFTKEFALFEQAILAMGLIGITWFNYKNKKISIGNLKNKLYLLVWSSFWGFLPLVLSYLIEYDVFRMLFHDVAL